MYRVMKKFGRGPETLVNSFKTIGEAKACIQEKLAEDAAHKINAIYCLYEGFDLMEEFDQSKLETSPEADSDSDGGAQRGSGQTFNPSPFSMTPQPKGMPQSWARDEDKKDDKK